MRHWCIVHTRCWLSQRTGKDPRFIHHTLYTPYTFIHHTFYKPYTLYTIHFVHSYTLHTVHYTPYTTHYTHTTLNTHTLYTIHATLTKHYTGRDPPADQAACGTKAGIRCCQAAETARAGGERHSRRGHGGSTDGSDHFRVLAYSCSGQHPRYLVADASLQHHPSRRRGASAWRFRCQRDRGLGGDTKPNGHTRPPSSDRTSLR
jgi:hypothetical protein